MAKILCIETSASALSVCLAEDGCILADRVCAEPRQQAALTAPLVKEVLSAAGVTVKDCDAVCVSAGPGSYTGLRVGASTAKGLAFGAGIPLLAVGTLDVLVAGALGAQRLRGSGGVAPQSVEDSIEHGNNRWIVPMLDARRMEVYTAVYTPDGKRITPVEAHVVTADSFAAQRARGKVLFVGDGALKCKEVLGGDGLFVDAQPLARNMVPLAFEAFEAGKFEDVAYFEPFYLKDFVATVSKKQLW